MAFSKPSGAMNPADHANAVSFEQLAATPRDEEVAVRCDDGAVVKVVQVSGADQVLRYQLPEDDDYVQTTISAFCQAFRPVMLDDLLG